MDVIQAVLHAGHRFKNDTRVARGRNARVTIALRGQRVKRLKLWDVQRQTAELVVQRVLPQL